MKRFKDAYSNLKDKIGHIPMLTDFVQYGNINVADIIGKFKSLYNMHVKFEGKTSPYLNDIQQKFLFFISKEISVSKRPVESILLQSLIKEIALTDQQVTQLMEKYNIFYDKETLLNIDSILNLSYFMDRNQKKYGSTSLIEHKDKIWKLSDEFSSELQNNYFKNYVQDALSANLLELSRDSFELNNRFTISKKYYRNDVIKLLNWPKEQNAQNVGGYIMHPDKKFFPIFIALEKTEKFQNKIAYEDQFIDRNTMRWFSKSGRSTQSRQENIVINNKDFGMIQLFVKKSDDDKHEGNDFYYLGSAKVVNAENEIQKNSEA